MSNNEDKVKSIITTGSEMVGAAAGGVLGFLLGGPAGAAAGGVAGVAISKTTSKVLTDVANRSLSHREEIRIGIAATFAIEKIQKKLAAGEQPRNDCFFQTQHNVSRSSAEEIFEGVLLKSKNEHEEKKIKLLANIFANVAFVSGLRVGEANHILQIADNLTYRQMCILGLFQRKTEIQDIKLKENDYRTFQGSLSYETASILQETYQLYNFGLLACRNSTSNGYEAMLGWTDTAPNRMELTILAKRYYSIIGLDEIPIADLRDVAVFLIK